MERSLSFLDDEGWPSDEGWPYADDADGRDADPAADLDDDIVAIHVTGVHLFDGLNPLEASVVRARFGFDGGSPRTIGDIQHETGLPRSVLRSALGDGLAKVRTRLASDVR